VTSSERRGSWRRRATSRAQRSSSSERFLRENAGKCGPRCSRSGARGSSEGSREQRSTGTSAGATARSERAPRTCSRRCTRGSGARCSRATSGRAYEAFRTAVHVWRAEHAYKLDDDGSVLNEYDGERGYVAPALRSFRELASAARSVRDGVDDFAAEDCVTSWWNHGDAMRRCLRALRAPPASSRFEGITETAYDVISPFGALTRREPQPQRPREHPTRSHLNATAFHRGNTASAEALLGVTGTVFKSSRTGRSRRCSLATERRPRGQPGTASHDLAGLPMFRELLNTVPAAPHRSAAANPPRPRAQRSDYASRPHPRCAKRLWLVDESTDAQVVRAHRDEHA
jgi:hypothetical protein